MVNEIPASFKWYMMTLKRLVHCVTMTLNGRCCFDRSSAQSVPFVSFGNGTFDASHQSFHLRQPFCERSLESSTCLSASVSAFVNAVELALVDGYLLTHPLSENIVRGADFDDIVRHGGEHIRLADRLQAVTFYRREASKSIRPLSAQNELQLVDNAGKAG